jgi:transcriptional regulator with XRE-family HTH domain
MSAKNIGEAVRKGRKALKITQPHLSELAGISVNSLYKLKRGTGNPTL